MRRQFVNELTQTQLLAVLNDWAIWGRPEQWPPSGKWRNWLFMGGRGAGKTLAGARWIAGLVAGWKNFAIKPVGSIALIGETRADVRDVMITGESGILRHSAPGNSPVWKSSLGMLEWPNGARAYAFSAEDPESLRGPQFEAAWCDELAKWRYGQQVQDMLQFGLRLGDNPRQLVTTTPRNVPALRNLVENDATVITRATTMANAANLAPEFLAYIKEKYDGTALGRQEIEGELFEDFDGALWSRDDLEKCRSEHLPALKRIVVAVDPPASSHSGSDACGIVVAGVDHCDIAWVLEDATIQGKRPEIWAQRAISRYNHYRADCLIAEANQGGDMVDAVLRGCDANANIKLVHARFGKKSRAEPVAALYARKRVRHLCAFRELEDEMCLFGSKQKSGSPDRVDALVWALSELILRNNARPKVRTL